MARVRPLEAVARGLAAGAVGTATMTAWQELSSKLQASGADGSDRSSQAPAEQQDPWEQAPAPAKVGRRLIAGVFERDVRPEQIGLLANVMHWAYGVGWGAAYGLLQAAAPGRPLRHGVLFGTGVWATSYLTLVPMGFYRPPWEYAPRELALDVSYHLAYGAGVAGGYAATNRFRDGPPRRRF